MTSRTIEFRFGDHTYAYPHPIQLLTQSFDTQDMVSLMRSPGALSAETILTDRGGNVWLTDFLEAGMAPDVWNYADLEASLLLDLTEGTNLHLCHEIEDVLARGDFTRLDINGVDPAGRKLLSNVASVRSALSKPDSVRQYEYNLAVMFLAFKRVCEFDPSRKHSPAEVICAAHALMTTGRLLKLLRLPSPPVGQRETGLRFDLAGAAVWVDGRRKPVSGQSLTLLAYLYERPGMVRTRAEIFHALWGFPYVESDSSHIARLNRSIDRLREKIQPDPSAPRYIITNPGSGYYLLVKPATSPS